jgi:hypothetical protein
MIGITTFTFPVIVNGNKLSATVLGEEGEDRDFHYRVGFSNQYEDVFHVVNDRLVGMRGKDSDAYAEAIKYDVGLSIGLDSDKFWYVFQELVEGEPLNVWVFEQEEEDEEENIYTTFNVHVKGKYRFHLMNVGDGWIASTKNEMPLTESDRMLAEKVEDLLIALL